MRLLALLLLCGSASAGVMTYGSNSITTVSNINGQAITPATVTASTVTINCDGESAGFVIGSTFTVNCQTGASTFGGNVVFSSYSHVQANTATAFVLKTGATTVVNFNATTQDTLSEFNTTTASGTFTASFAGNYLITMSVLTSVPAQTTTIVSCIVLVNGTARPWARFTQASTPTNSGCSVATSVKLSAGDKVQTAVFHNDSADLTLFADSARNVMTVDRLP